MTTTEENRTRADFVRLLFRLLDEPEIRYCTLHSLDELPENLPSDLELAIHPDDLQKLSGILLTLGCNGYRPLQGASYEINHYRLDFLWFEDLVVNSAGINITCGCVGEALVGKRHRRRNYWIADTASEFAYLLTLKTSMGILSERQAQRLECLTKEIEAHQGNPAAADLSCEKYKVTANDGRIHNRREKSPPKLRGQLWQPTPNTHTSLNSILRVVANARRCIRLWLEPNGIFVVFLGPDGVGKSTLIKCLIKSIGPTFRHDRVFHWRPMLLWRREHPDETTDPHGRPQHSTWWSIGRLFAHVLDYWLGYWLVIRPLVARTGLVIFDRYYYDLLVDPNRYRYGGPIWAARFLRAFIPKPDLLFVLDASEDVVLSRKQEVTPEEIRRQRSAYQRETKCFPFTRVIDTSAPMREVSGELSHSIADYLARRFLLRNADWLVSGMRPEQTEKLGSVHSV